MKVMIRDTAKGLSAYIARKDLEQAIVEMERQTLWGGWIKLANGWIFDLPEMDTEPRLPITVNARKRGDEADA